MPWHSLNGQTWWAPNSFNFLRKQIGSNLVSHNECKTNIFITRSSARWRKVINENRLFDIAKNYSSPKSGKFINGLLDVISLNLLKEKKIIKTGKGLIDNK